MTDSDYFRSMARIYDALASAESELFYLAYARPNERTQDRIVKNVRACLCDIEDVLSPTEPEVAL